MDDQPTSEQHRYDLERVGDAPAADSFARDVREGLTASPKRLSCRYLYDAKGSRIFEEITRLPEYYVLRAEREILRDHADEIVGHCFSHPTARSAATGDPLELVELGSGSAEKTRYVIEALLRRQRELCFVPIDVSESALRQSAIELLRDYPGVRVRAMMGDYADALQALHDDDRHARLILWLGSSIGNFRRADAAAFLSRVRAQMEAADRLFVGFDRRKDARVLEAAYDDASGVTAAFNLNLLERINRELGGHFDLTAFEHRARYEPGEGRVVLSLVSRHAQRVRIDALDLEVKLQAGEAIHTEDSYKYSLEEIEALAGEAGLQLTAQWMDGEERFCDVLLAPS